MKKLENFSRCLTVLKKADFQMAANDEIYRMGLVGQFNLSFELAWKALKSILEADGVGAAETGSARDILKLGAAVGYLKDEEIWLLMLRKRNMTTHIYNERDVDELIILIRDSFLPCLERLRTFLLEKEAERDEKLL